MNIYFFLTSFFLVQILLFYNEKSHVVISTLNYQFSIKKFLINQFVIIDFILLLLLAILRDKSIGKDYTNYLFYFDRLRLFSIFEIREFTTYSKLEYGFSFVAKIIQYISKNNLMLIGCIYLALLYCVFKFIKEFSSDFLGSIFLFLTLGFYNQSFNIMRQYLAAGIVLCALKYIEKKDLKYFLILILLATSIHKTALVAILIYPIVNSKYNIKIISAGILGLFLSMYIFSDYIFLLFSKLVGKEKYAYRGVGELGIGLVINLLITLTFVVFYNQIAKVDSRARLWLFMSVMTVAFNILTVKLDIIGRMMIYFKMGYIASIPQFVRSFQTPIIKRALKMVLLILFCGYYLYGMTISNLSQTVPYTSTLLHIK